MLFHVSHQASVLVQYLSDISPLASMNNLCWLNLANNQIGEILPPVNLTGLGTLILDNNQISDISPLIYLSCLTWLDD
jgi:internalin A